MPRISEIEQAFLREIAANPRDNTARLVYADWLDEKGDPRGEYLRVHCELSTLPPSDERYQSLLEREHELQAECEPDWLRQVGQPRIENCDVSHSGLQFAYECPMAWNELHPTENKSVRHCDACREEVYFCNTMHKARFFARLGHCIAVNTSLVREEGDLKSTPNSDRDGHRELGRRTMRMGKLRPIRESHHSRNRSE